MSSQVKLSQGKKVTSSQTTFQNPNIEMHFLEAAEIFLSQKGALLPFRPFPAASQREEYDKLPSWLKQKVISMGEDFLGYSYPPIQATDFMAFSRTGNRVAYEDVYFAKRYALNSLVAAECVEYQGRFLDDIINGIFVICEESAWQLPPHNSYARSQKQFILPDYTRPVLDLFACETGAELACISYLLSEQLNMVSPYILKRIDYELERRIITPYLKEHFWWMGQGDEPMCNWTPWCTQNVLLTFFLSANTLTQPQDNMGHPSNCPEPHQDSPDPHQNGPELHQNGPELLQDSRKPPFCSEHMGNSDVYLHSSAIHLQGDIEHLSNDMEELGRAIIKKAAGSCDYFLKDYGEDGCCDEGAQYYRHAGLCLDGAANVLNQVTGGAFNELMQWTKVRNIASYILNVHVDDKYYFNFADCSPIAGRAGVREYLFGKHTKQPALMQFAAEDFRAAKDMLFADESHQLNLFYRLQTIFCYEEISAFHVSIPPTEQDVFYPSVGLFLTRNETFSLAVKAGDNNDGHNHNDVGSLTLYKNGHPILVDIGVESYTQKTFSADRYSIWTLQSCYHNLPTIEGRDQHAGANYCARQVVTSMNQNGKSSISMELSGAYPLPAPACSYSRSVVLDKNVGCITLTDRTDSQNVILNFITYDKPQATGNTIQVGSARLTFSGASLAAIEVLPITDQRLRIAWDHDLYRIRLRLEDSEFQMNIL